MIRYVIGIWVVHMFDPYDVGVRDMGSGFRYKALYSVWIVGDDLGVSGRD